MTDNDQQQQQQQAPLPPLLTTRHRPPYFFSDHQKSLAALYIRRLKSDDDRGDTIPIPDQRQEDELGGVLWHGSQRSIKGSLLRTITRGWHVDPPRGPRQRRRGPLAAEADEREEEDDDDEQWSETDSQVGDGSEVEEESAASSQHASMDQDSDCSGHHANADDANIERDAHQDAVAASSDPADADGDDDDDDDDDPSYVPSDADHEADPTFLTEAPLRPCTPSSSSSSASVRFVDGDRLPQCAQPGRGWTPPPTINLLHERYFSTAIGEDDDRKVVKVEDPIVVEDSDDEARRERERLPLMHLEPHHPRQTKRWTRYHVAIALRVPRPRIIGASVPSLDGVSAQSTSTSKPTRPKSKGMCDMHPPTFPTKDEKGAESIDEGRDKFKLDDDEGQKGKIKADDEVEEGDIAEGQIEFEAEAIKDDDEGQMEMEEATTNDADQDGMTAHDGEAKKDEDVAASALAPVAAATTTTTVPIIDVDALIADPAAPSSSSSSSAEHKGLDHDIKKEGGDEEEEEEGYDWEDLAEAFVVKRRGERPTRWECLDQM
ncbi:uncharacterized protein PSFLO_07641 [Pseudozyma flocculosa]|nr:uncharacterized protein PSFLO_07641 [Pseudozyma flocculosa]